jgi:ABC-type branched-subunit amino acid transport system ATPase component
VALLEVTDLGRRFGGVRALDGAELRIDANEIVSLIGPNGSGKTTLFNCLTGIYRPDRGHAFWTPGSCDLCGLPPYAVARLGIARTFQNIRLFARLSVLENVMLAAQATDRLGAWRNLLTARSARAAERARYALACELLDLVGLAQRAADAAGALPYGLQRRLEIARAMATAPKLLLLDEPCAGLNPQEIDALMGLIRQLRERGVAIFLIEHSMQIVMQISDRIVVFDAGSKIAEGSPEAIQRDDRVLAAYLGVAQGA